MANSLNGITDIEFVPGFDYREVVGKLQPTLRASDKLRAAVAYWCVGIKEVGPALVERLSGDGFLCVDIHLPTDIDRLCQMKSAGANIYLYLLNPNPQPGELRSKVPPHLLHPKILLFDYPSGPSELWVGSHNWTARALTGVNIEASLRVRLAAESGLYSDAANFLLAVRASCVPFDVSAVSYYKWLQQIDQEEEIWVLELRGMRSVIDTEQKLTVFGNSEEDYRNLKNVDKNIVISLLDETSGEEILYEAAIRDTGRRPTKGGVTLDARLYASHDGTPRPKIEGPKIPEPALVSAASSWATVDIIEELFGGTFEIPPRERWITAENSAGHFQIPPELRRWFPNPQKPLVQRAVSRSEFEEPRTEQRDKPVLLMEEGPKLLRKKAVRAKRRDGQSFSLRGKRRPEDEERK
jgi:hypothetical protein